MATKLKHSPDCVLLFHDECICVIGASPHACWGPKGEAHKFADNGSRKRAIVSGVLDSATGKAFLSITEQMNSERFIDFLQQVLLEYIERKIFLVVDNASWHKSKEVKEFLQLNRRLKLIFLPPYSPELNPIEKLWKWLKYTVNKNRYYRHLKELIVEIREFASAINEVPEMTKQRTGLMH